MAPSCRAAGAPPLMLDADWIRENRDAFDVFHVHFGFDWRSLPELEEALAALDDLGAPLVFTLHDLRNPHHRDPEPHDAQLDLLVRHAAELVTLTPGAARAIHARWGRRAHVMPHPRRRSGRDTRRSCGPVRRGCR